jgi:RHH-type transcriptional regulator, proline utilization regulon repressor / proline dehydrogenase / delta 1-pyrroline-5-carboxylate dehydrogenase
MGSSTRDLPGSVSMPRGAAADPLAPAQLEAATHRWGRRIIAEIGALRRLGSGGAPRRALIRLLGEDEALRFALLRFVDVYPGLRGPGEIGEHLRQYLEVPARHARRRVGGVTATALLMASRWMPARPLAWLCARIIDHLGRTLIAGESPDDVAPRLLALERRGLAFSLDLLGEHVAGAAQADAFARRYAAMIESLPDRLGPLPASASPRPAGPRINLSIKLSSLTHHFDPLDPEGTARDVLARLRPLFASAQRSEAFLNVDMERYELRDLTLDLVRRLLRDPELHGYPHVGVVMQAYLRDAESTLTRWLDFMDADRRPMTIRLVKGAYWDSEQLWAVQKGWPNPVLLDKRATDAQYERMTRALLARGAFARTSVASHNIRSIAHALAAKEALGVPDDAFEVQLLYGMADELAAALVRLGVPVRIYAPCGELVAGMSYLVRRILENTANTSFLRHAVIGDRGEDRLLMNPEGAPLA